MSKEVAVQKENDTEKNESINSIIDKLSPNFDNEYGKIKDIMAGAVLLSAILALIIGFLVLSKPILYFFGGL